MVWITIRLLKMPSTPFYLGGGGGGLIFIVKMSESFPTLKKMIKIGVWCETIEEKDLFQNIN